MDKKITGDGSLTFSVNDNVRLSGGAGSIVMDAYPALPNDSHVASWLL
jgi:hypothetical protein